MGQALNAVPIFASSVVSGTLDDLTNTAVAFTALAGTPVNTATAVGPLRTGNVDVSALPSVGRTPNTRGGVVTEFRSIPGYHEGVAAWRTLGQSFFSAAHSRNQRSGLAP